jgi:hypothetical protein
MKIVQWVEVLLNQKRRKQKSDRNKTNIRKCHRKNERKRNVEVGKLRPSFRSSLIPFRLRTSKENHLLVFFFSFCGVFFVGRGGCCSVGILIWHTKAELSLNVCRRLLCNFWDGKKADNADEECQEVARRKAHEFTYRKTSMTVEIC